MTTYYIRIKDGQYDEEGFIYHGVNSIRVPEGFVAIFNMHCTTQATEVVPADEVAEISKEAYDRIEECIVDGEDPSDAIADAITEATKTPDEKLREALNEFKRAAYHLMLTWEGMDIEDEEKARINTAYPFEESFDELYLKIQDWGIGDYDE